tara:strand:+ start:15696 stop:15839 length:144 start_codon:yes stop_codon:yes gene_type:complete
VDKVLDHVVEMEWTKVSYPQNLRKQSMTVGLLWVAVDSSVDKETPTD